MEIKRKPFQGILNIISFNRHFFIALSAGIVFLFSLFNYTPPPFQEYLFWILTALIILFLVPLAVSWYVYDVSDLYSLKWLNDECSNAETIININAGFDEISPELRHKYPGKPVITLDFYNIKKHTEISIRRARAKYPPSADTIQISTAKIPLENDSADVVIIFLSAHEIRDHSEKITFFTEVKRILKPQGKIFVTEHLRDLPNLLAYNIGFLHFYSRRVWNDAFKKAGLELKYEKSITPFISTFTLQNENLS